MDTKYYEFSSFNVTFVINLLKLKRDLEILKRVMNLEVLSQCFYLPLARGIAKSLLFTLDQ